MTSYKVTPNGVDNVVHTSLFDAALVINLKSISYDQTRVKQEKRKWNRTIAKLSCERNG